MIIFNLDGTLADCEHRRHFIDPYKNENLAARYKKDTTDIGFEWFNKETQEIWEPDYSAFYEACDKDEPILPVIMCFEHFVDNFGSERIQIWSGRCESTRQKTIEWLDKWVPYFSNKIEIKMRPLGDVTPEHKLKQKWLNEVESAVRKSLFVFDTGQKVCRMWRLNDIFVFNCNQTEYEY